MNQSLRVKCVRATISKRGFFTRALDPLPLIRVIVNLVSRPLFQKISLAELKI